MGVIDLAGHKTVRLSHGNKGTRGHTAVMNQRSELADALDDFPTPPWATRSLADIVLPQLGFSLKRKSIWEPAAGRGVMARVLAEYTDDVHSSDVHDYGGPYPLSALGSFVGQGADVADGPDDQADWIVTNPPFKLGTEFFERAIEFARVGVALLVRSNWAEGLDRYSRIFSKRPPAVIAQFCERVPMVRGRWDPDASSATSYAWFVWSIAFSRLTGPKNSSVFWIPPGQRTRLTKPSDAARFAEPFAYKIGV